LNSGLIYTAILAEFNPLEPIEPAAVFTFSIWGRQVVISNHMFIVSVAMLFLMIFIPLAAKKNGLVPKGIRNLVESICVYLREEMARPLLKEQTDNYIGFIWTVFFFVLSLNLLGMVPSEKIIYLLTGKMNRFGGPATADIYVTGAMAVVVFFMTHISGIRRQGLRHYLASLAPKVPWWIMPMIYFLEVVTMFVRPFTLAIRLFANIIAGHILLAILIGLIMVFKSYFVAGVSIFSVVSLSLLELLVAFIQAYIFTFLSALYISFAVQTEH
jgi:F-type H+-transporting ATPase subunit a